MWTHGTVLFVDDEPSIRLSISRCLELQGIPIQTADSAEQAIRDWDGTYSCILTDLCLPGMPGAEFLAWIRSRNPEMAVVVISAFADLDEALECIQQGATDFIRKPARIEEITKRILRSVEHCRASQRYPTLQQRLQQRINLPTESSEPILTDSFRRELGRVFPLDSILLLTGESGAGKSHLAKFIHRHSPRKNAPFVTVNCPGLPHDLIETELFGHEKAVSTNATHCRPGRIEVAEGGTLFLDEIAEMPLPTQSRLLSFLHSRAYRRSNGNHPAIANVRIICATNRNLEYAVHKGSFREDLYFRLSAVHIRVPPLRESPEIIDALTDRRIRDLNLQSSSQPIELSTEARTLLKRHTWPGNIRELHHFLERVHLFRNNHSIPPEEFTFPLKPTIKPIQAATLPTLSLHELERLALTQALAASGGNRTKAARMLGVSEKTIYNMIHRHNFKAALQQGDPASH